MSDVYISYNNIVSSFGTTSEVAFEHLVNENSALQRVQDKNLLPVPFYSSLINEKVLEEAFESLDFPHPYTRLERMMITSLTNVVTASKIKLTDNVGLIVSTTKGNIDALDNQNPFPESRAYLSALGGQLKSFFGFVSEPIVLSNACVSGVLALAVAKKFIKEGRFKHVFVVGGDLVSRFTLSGFHSLQALSDKPCKPYSKERKGINLGEVACSALVTEDKRFLAPESVTILGDSTCNDANHISGPSRTGEGLVRCVQTAMKEAAMTTKKIHFISAHGTATEFNDEMEAIAFNRLGLADLPLHSLKGYFGHTLGASGLLETIIGMHSLHHNTLIKSKGFTKLGVSKPLNIIQETRDKEMDTFLKTASGFGGCNTAMILQKAGI